MTNDRTDDELVETLRLAQRLGVLGPAPVEEAVAHARRFVMALGPLEEPELDGGLSAPRAGGSSLGPVTGRVVDLGSGGGLPGLVVAWDRPDLEVVLVDRRTKRTDLLERAVRRLRLGDRVVVRAEDAAVTIRRFGRTFDAVVARSFGPPAATLRTAAVLRRPGGRIVVSDPPAGDRWDPEVLRELGLRRTNCAGLPVFVDPVFVDPVFVDPGFVDPVFVDPGFVDPVFVDPDTLRRSGGG